MPRNVFAKALRKYSFNTIEEELMAAWDSPYRHWWALMCCSRDYWWVCQQKGNTLDSRLRRVYDAFGDKCQRGFDEWWRFAARDQFVEQVSPEGIERIDSSELIDTEDFARDSNWMHLRVPLNIGEAKLVSDFKNLLRGHPNRTNTRKQTSNFPIRRHKGSNLEVFRKAVEVWHEVNKLQRRRVRTEIVRDDEDSFYQIGARLRLSESLIIQENDTRDRKAKKRNAMKVAVSRMLSRAERLIQNVEIGIFPSYEPVPIVRRWTSRQQAELDAAVALGAWRPVYMDHQAWGVRFARIHKEEQRRRDTWLRRVESLRRANRPDAGDRQ